MLLRKTHILTSFVTVILLLGIYQTARASHLVGGYISYECLGSNTYAVKLRVYRDCNPNTLKFDSIADIEVLDAMGNLVVELNVLKGPTIPIDTDTSGCVSTPPGVCVEYADYLDTVVLMPLAGGYSIVYRKCCRNKVIVNIPSPNSQGYTYTTTIPNLSTGCNSSPQLPDVPPILLCLNRPIDFTLNTTEPDGDSLHFELCDILDGQDPYFPIPFLPPFTSQSPMAASPPFAIHPQTGKISGTPTQRGQYVVGICITEYRNGVPLSTVRFDYQFNITNCASIFSDILTMAEDSTLKCQGLTMNFFTQSQNASSYFWDFGDTTTLADTSRAANPVYHYSTPGFYEVTHIAQPGDICSDTATTIFEVKVATLPTFQQPGIICFSEQPVTLSATGMYPPGSSYLWEFGPGASYDSSEVRNPPPVRWNTGGEHYIDFSVIYGDCKYTRRDTIVIRDELVSDLITSDEDSNLACNGLTVQFTSETQGANGFFWDFGDPSTLADTSSSRNPAYTFPAPGQYLVTLVSEDSACTDTIMYAIEVQEALEPEIEANGRTCFESQNVSLSANGGNYPVGTDFTWDVGPLAEKQQMKGPIVWPVFVEPGTFPVSLTVSMGYCTETIFDTVVVEALSAVVDAGDTQIVKPGQRVNLRATSGSSFYWSASAAVYISSPFSQATTVDLSTNEDTIIFYVRVTDEWGCEGIDSTLVIVHDPDQNKPVNYISPNEDGRNDYFDLAELIGGEDCGLTILNRWGSEVYRAEEYHNDWAGTDKQGRPLPDGTYYYIVFCYPEVLATGPITIMRNNMK